MLIDDAVINLCLSIATGVGALYIRRRPRVRVEPIQSGGGQERYYLTKTEA